MDLRILATSAGVAIAFLMATTAHQSASDITRPTLVMHVKDYAGMTDRDLNRAETEASRIYDAVGVGTVWTIDGVRTSADQLPALHVRVIVLQRDMAQRMILEEHRADNVLGRAVPEASMVYIFYNRAIDAIDQRGKDRGSMLGRIFAHEVGHVLLGHHHSPEGLMRPELDMSVSGPQFTRAQGVEIRRLLVDSRIVG